MKKGSIWAVGFASATFFCLSVANALAQTFQSTGGTSGASFQSTGGTTGCGGSYPNLINPLCAGNINNFGALAAQVDAFLLAIAVPLCGIMVIVGAFQMMTAAGDPTKFGNGRKTIVYAAIGFVIVLFASSVVPVLKSILGG